MKDYLARWLDAKREDLRPSTWTTYESLLRGHVLPMLGTVRLMDLSPAKVQAMIDAVRRTALSTRTVSYTRSVLRMALQDAVRLGVLLANPVDRTRGPKQSPRRVEAFTVEQVETLAANADGTRVAHLLPFAALAGLRRGEALALQWSDVDLVDRSLPIDTIRVLGSRQLL